MTRSVRGIIVPIVTPLEPGGEVDSSSLARLTNSLVDAGVHGIFALGSTGEAAYLTDSKRVSVVETVVEAVAGRVPVLVGALGTTTTRVLDQAVMAIDRGASGIVATTPYYARCSIQEVIRHFEMLSTCIDVPLVAYNIPANTRTSLPVEVVADLMWGGTLQAVKDSSGDLAWMRDLLHRTQTLDSVSVLTGSDVLADVALGLGAHGVVAGLSNVEPLSFISVYNGRTDGRGSVDSAGQGRIAQLAAMYRGPAPPGTNAQELGAIKAALVQMGQIRYDTLSEPMLQATADLHTYVHHVLYGTSGPGTKSANAAISEEGGPNGL